MLSGKTAVVTGASRGIGRAIAEKLAAEGAFVVINYNGSKEAAETVLAGIRAAGGDGCVMQCNVSDFAACEAWMKEILALYGKIDILVNNAGITKDGLLMGMSEEAFDRVIETNLKGTFNCIRFAARPMIRQKSGCHHQHGFCGRRGRKRRTGKLCGIESRCDRPDENSGTGTGIPRHPRQCDCAGLY